MAQTVRASPLSCLIAFLAMLLLSATAMAGVTSWLAYLRPEKGIEWQPIAWLAAGFLALTALIFGFAWYRAKHS